MCFFSYVIVRLPKLSRSAKRVETGFVMYDGKLLRSSAYRYATGLGVIAIT